MTCPNCGAPVADNRRFCGKCGTAIAPPAPDPATAAPVSPTGAPPTAWGSSASPYAPPPPPSAGPPADSDPFAPPDLNAPPGWAAPTPPPPPPGYGAPPPQYPPPQYPPPGGWSAAPYPYAGHQDTNGMAIASLVLGLVGPFTCGIGSVLAIVLGFVAREQIKRSWGRQTGSGMATAGIVLGFVVAAFWLVVMIIAVVDSAVSTG